MNRKIGSWIILLFVLLAVGLTIGHWFWSSQAPLSVTSFRVWWWENKELDVAVQVGLMFAGALGIAALMPPEDES
jgi:hypothetical protein